MRMINWKVGGFQTPVSELIRYAAETEPPIEDINAFVVSAKLGRRLLPLQTSRYVLRETRQTLSWLKAYIRCEVEDLHASFVRTDKSFYIALLEHHRTADRSVAFRLTTADLEGYTEWRVSLRRVSFEGDTEYFLCAE
jgi:hypothetical protein